MKRRDFLGNLGLMALLSSCASTGRVPTGAVDPSPAGVAAGMSEQTRVPVFFDARSGERLGRRSLLAKVVVAPILLLGEVHDNAIHHEVRAWLLPYWAHAASGRPVAVVFEHLDREHNDALRLAQRQPVGGTPTARLAHLLDAAHFDRRSWGWPLHQPLFEAAQVGGATWIAANLSRESAQRLSRDPRSPVEPALQAIVESARWPESAQQALVQALTTGHCEIMAAEAIEKIVRIQRLRDAALALPLLDANERRSVLLAGNGHVRRDHGVPLYLGAYEKEALVVGFEEVDESSASGSGAAGLAKKGTGRVGSGGVGESKVGQSGVAESGLAESGAAGSGFKAFEARADSLEASIGPTRAAELGRAYDLVCLTHVRRAEDPCTATGTAARRAQASGAPAFAGPQDAANADAQLPGGAIRFSPGAPTRIPLR